jgi:hypothetical protein
MSLIFAYFDSLHTYILLVHSYAYSVTLDFTRYLTLNYFQFQLLFLSYIFIDKNKMDISLLIHIIQLRIMLFSISSRNLIFVDNYSPNESFFLF